MPPNVSYAKYDIPYPIFEAEFDPSNRGYLLVAGGGGENNTGVDNKITLLDVSNRSSITKAAEIDLSKDEDSVQSLASLATKDGLVVFAGINSGSRDIKTGKNEHFRSYMVDLPKRDRKGETTPQGKIGLLSKTAIFDAPDASSKTQTYQRLLRLSPTQGQYTRDATGSKRVGAMGTAWAKQNEVVLFDATVASLKKENIITRFATHDGKEAEDLDILELGNGSFSLAYCTDSSVLLYTWTFDFAKRKLVKSLVKKPVEIYTAGMSSSGGGSKAKLRSLRWISPEHLLVMQNFAAGGAELLVLQIDPASISDNHTHDDAHLVIRKRLPSSMKQAVNRGLDVCILDSDPATGERQIVVALAGSDRSIHLLTTNHSPQEKAASRRISRFAAFDVLKDVHPNAIGKLTFTNFFPPKQPANSTMSVAATAQYIQLASISVANTVVVDSLALTSTTTKPSDTSDVPGRIKNPSVRYVLSTPGAERMRSWSTIIYMSALILFAAVFIRSGLSASEVQGYSTPLHGAVDAVAGLAQYLPPQLQPDPQWLDQFKPTRPSISSQLTSSTSSLPTPSALHPSAISAALATPDPSQIVHFHHPGDDTESDADTANIEVAAALHAPSSTAHLVEAGAVKYEDLSPPAKKRWRERLAQAGHWAEGQGESVLLGVLFSEYAGAVGGGIRDALLG